MTYLPFAIGRRFRIVPPGTEPGVGKIDLVMDRGAFGSGEHETTASCLEILETLDLDGKGFLDLGSGTGILAIAARKLGAKEGLCIDIDPMAVESARRNCRLNGIAGELEHRCGSLAEVGTRGFDLVIANVYGDILLAVCRDLVAAVKPGGLILLSGILWEYNFDVRNRYQKAGCDVLRNRLLPEFSTVLLKKKPETSLHRTSS